MRGRQSNSSISRDTLSTNETHEKEYFDDRHILKRFVYNSKDGVRGEQKMNYSSQIIIRMANFAIP